MTDKLNPYIQCPTYETAHFILRLIRLSDAVDLLECYSDPVSAPIFNSDNCTSNFIYKTLKEMKNCVQFWVMSYENQYFIRFSIIDKAKSKAVGTIEFFAKPGNFGNYGQVGILRLDLGSPYEKEALISEILNLIDDNFYDLFKVENIFTKSIPEAKQRISAFNKNGYKEIKDNPIMPYDDYYIRNKVIKDEQLQTCKDVVESIGYCGLVCKFCHLADRCSGCKSEQNCCGRHLSADGCYQYNCCKERGLNGCWECEDFCCGKDMFSDTHDVRLRAFVRCAKEDGLEKLAEHVVRNQQKGILYGYQKDYDNLGNEEAVLELLRTGRKQ